MAATYALRATRRAGTTGAINAAELENARIGHVIDVLNSAGSMTFDIDTLDPKASFTKVLLNEFQVWRDDVLIWWGYPIARRIGADHLTVQCVGLWDYFSHRFVHDFLTYTQVEQMTIGFNLVNYAQTKWPGAALGISSGSFTGGVLRDRTYNAFDYGNIAQLVKDLTALQNGFDFSIEIFGDGRREWTPWYPQKGTTRTDLTLEYGRNIVEGGFEINEDASKMADWVTATGTGDGAAKLAQTFINETSRDTYGLMQDVVSDSNVLQLPTLLERAKAEVGARNKPVRVASVTVEDLVDSSTGAVLVPVVGVIKTGDIVPIRIDYGEAQIAQSQRVISTDIDAQTDRLTLSFN